ncbi:c-type cytochrome [Halieaceae bacterium IMCC14734]|uniref:C-type cytochrome n=2 Tax=Candidatus Litorirhabdus singularis TaxID=2518993 RepID=A0ABT3TCJ2_9GAMM|nr:c-type cytochrome [Candidatus Litorirhabdus singularis]
MLGVLMSQLATAQDLAAGKVAYGICASCHGAAGEGRAAMNSPALAGQDADYLARQLNHFKSGIRGAAPGDTFGAQMRGMAGTLASDEAVTAVAAYLASLPAAVSTETLEADMRNGENQYNAYCGACHGAQAQGNPALNSPRLAGLDRQYLARQLQNYAAGIRGNHADDRYGRQMKMMATVLPDDKAVADVLAFIVSQGSAQ